MRVSFFLFLTVFNWSLSQSNDYSLLNITDSISKNANAVVNFNSDVLIITSIDKMVLSSERVVTVYNEKGFEALKSYVRYNNSIKVKNLEINVLDLTGKSVKKFKKNDFNDYSLADDVSFVTDDRILVMNFNPLKYPVVLKINKEIEYKNTAFLPDWQAVDFFNIGVVLNEFRMINKSGIELNYRENNFDKGFVDSQKKGNELRYKITNFPPLEHEDLMPDLTSIVPNVKFSLREFNLEGSKGTTENWKFFGEWMKNELLKNVEELPDETVKEIINLTKDIPDTLFKAKRVYEYMQNKTRYVSIQLGIGGWKPMEAKIVDKLGYGDCKALTNYTKSLLNAIGIKSFYTIVYANYNEKENIDRDFVSMQGNHVVLTLPYKGENYLIECTSQTMPFMYKSDMTDGRNVLVLTDKGGFIYTTKSYSDNQNEIIRKGVFELKENGEIEGQVSVNSKGTNYKIYNYLLNLKEEDVEKFYKSKLANLNNLQLNNFQFFNDKLKFEFIENLNFKANNYASIYGDDFVFKPNILDKDITLPKRVSNRKFPFQILRGEVYIDEFEIKIPDKFKIDFVPSENSLVTKFGSYTKKITIVEDKLILKNILKLKSGFFNPEDYMNYRKFIIEINMMDNAKVIINKK